MKSLEIYLDERPIGTVKVDNVRGHETWMFAYATSYLNVENPMLDPDIANVRGPQFPSGSTGYGFLSDVAPDRWGRKLIRRREQRPPIGVRDEHRCAQVGTECSRNQVPEVVQGRHDILLETF